MLNELTNFLSSKLSPHLAGFAVNSLHTLFSPPSLYLSHEVVTQAGGSDWELYQRSTHLTWIVPKVRAHYWPVG